MSERRGIKDGHAKGEGMPDGQRRNQNTEACDTGGSGYGQGQGRGKGRQR